MDSSWQATTLGSGNPAWLRTPYLPLKATALVFDKKEMWGSSVHPICKYTLARAHRALLVDANSTSCCVCTYLGNCNSNHLSATSPLTVFLATLPQRETIPLGNRAVLGEPRLSPLFSLRLLSPLRIPSLPRCLHSDPLPLPPLSISLPLFPLITLLFLLLSPPSALLLTFPYFFHFHSAMLFFSRSSTQHDVPDPSIHFSPPCPLSSPLFPSPLFSPSFLIRCGTSRDILDCENFQSPLGTDPLGPQSNGQGTPQNPRGPQ